MHADPRALKDSRALYQVLKTACMEAQCFAFSENTEGSWRARHHARLGHLAHISNVRSMRGRSRTHLKTMRTLVHAAGLLSLSTSICAWLTTELPAVLAWTVIARRYHASSYLSKILHARDSAYKWLLIPRKPSGVNSTGAASLIKMRAIKPRYQRE